MELEDIPEIKEGTHIKVEICSEIGSALSTGQFYITSKENIGTEKRPAVQVFGRIIAGSVYHEKESLYLDEILSFDVQESVK